MSETGLPSGNTFPEEQLHIFLFDTESGSETLTDPIAEALTPDNFLALLVYTRDSYLEGDPAVIEAVQRFALYTAVEFSEPATPEEEFTHLANKIEVEISSFIEYNHPATSFGLMGEAELELLGEIYNSHNLLAFAKDLVSRSPNGLGVDQMDMIYRYRTVLQCLVTQREKVHLAKSGVQLSPGAKDGARTWAGYIHPYGHLVGGIIDPEEYRDFSEGEEPEFREGRIAGIPVKASKIRRVQ